MRTALTNARILTPPGVQFGRTLLLDDARIVDVVAPDDPRCEGAQTDDLGGMLLVPGFIDTQVNGGGGVLFNDSPYYPCSLRIPSPRLSF